MHQLGLFIFAGIIAIGAIVLIYFKIRWSRASNAEARDFSDAIDADKKREKREKV